MNKSTATTNLVTAFKAYRTAVAEFNKATGCHVCGSVYIQILEDNAQILMDDLDCELDAMKKTDGWWKFEFEYQDVTFLWIEEAKEAE